MPLSLKNPPYLFTTKPIFFRGRRMNRMVQVYGKPGEIGRLLPQKALDRGRSEHQKYPHHFATV